MTLSLRKEETKNDRTRDFIRLRGARYVIQKNSATVFECTKCGFVNDYSMMYENASFLAQKSSHFSCCGFSRLREYAKCGFANISSFPPLASFIYAFIRFSSSSIVFVRVFVDAFNSSYFLSGRRRRF